MASQQKQHDQTEIANIVQGFINNAPRRGVAYVSFKVLRDEYLLPDETWIKQTITRVLGKLVERGALQRHSRFSFRIIVGGEK